MKKNPPPLLVVVIFAMVCSTRPVPAASVVGPSGLLFDVDFHSPGDTVNTNAVTSATANGAGVFEHPSAQTFGSTQVVASYGNLTGQPARMFAGPAGSFNYSQLRFDTQPFYNASNPVATRIIEFRFDLLLENLAGGSSTPNTNGSEDLFTLLVDAKSAHRIDFNGTNKIYFTAPAASPVLIGGYFESIAQHYSVINYLDENRMEVWQNGNLIFNGRFHTPYPADPSDPTSISGYRLNLADSSAFSTAPVAVIDNISIRVVPEPALPMLLAITAVAGVTLRRNRR